MTLHMHRVDDRTVVTDGNKPLDVPAGWQIADGSADDARVCGSHPWQSDTLVFANGDAYGTYECDFSSFIGDDRSFCCSVEKFTKNYKIPTPLKLKSRKSGKKFAGRRLVKEAQGVRAEYGNCDVLLRRRA
jgi:hypothetical protein